MESIQKYGILFYLYMIGILLILPIIPIMITSFIIAIIMRFTNLIKNKSKSMYMTIIFTTLMIGILIGLFNFHSSTSTFEEAVLEAGGLAESISDFFILIKPSMNILLNYRNWNGFVNFALYIVETLILYIVMLLIMSQIYLEGAKRNND